MDRIAYEYDAVPPLSAEPFVKSYYGELQRLEELDGPLVALCVCSLCQDPSAEVRQVEGRLLYTARRSDSPLDREMRIPALPKDRRRPYATWTSSALLDVPARKRDGPVRSAMAQCGTHGRLRVDEDAIVAAIATRVRSKPVRIPLRPVTI
jgi:hypothetical protein